MTVDPVIAYHLRELEIAKTPNSPEFRMPDIASDEKKILDIGCGIGQTFAAMEMGDRLLVGLDIDARPLQYGRNHFDHIRFVQGTAECLPFEHGKFDLVISRVALPYADIPRALGEIHRVLRPAGRIWFALHPFSMVRGEFIEAVRKRDWKDAVYRSYVICNGVLLALIGRQVPFFWKKKYESFQSVAGMKKALRRAGFAEIFVGYEGAHLICKARRAM